MNFFETVTGRVTKAVDYVVEKNRKAALINRIRIVIKNERENEARAYVALGKYYFQNLRDAQNEETEPLCKAVEAADRRIKKAFDKLDELTADEEYEDDACTDCTDDCDYCPCGCSGEPGAESADVPAPEPEDEIAPADFPLHFPIVDKANDRDDASEEAAEEAADDEDEVQPTLD
ncbi:hypothetical protein [Caproiciproducens sp.]